MSTHLMKPLLNSIPPELIERLDPAYVEFYNQYIVGRLSIHQVPIEKVREDPKKYTSNFSREYGGDVYRVSEQKIPVGGTEITVRIFEPSQWKDGDALRPAYVNYHGGGWSWGGLDMDDSFCRRITREVGCICFDVDYRLAPENPFPIPIEDSWTAYKWVFLNAHKFNIDVNRIAVGGMSAGAHISSVIAHKARDENIPLAFQFLAVGCYDLAGCFTSDGELKKDSQYYETLRELYWTPSLPVERMMYAQEMFVRRSRPETYETNWMISPVKAPNFANLAPALVITAELDGLKAEGRAYVTKLEEGGNNVEHIEFKGACHMFMFYDEILEAGKEYNRAAIRALKDGLLKKEQTSLGTTILHSAYPSLLATASMPT